jgi:2-polyprenyl-3-methyl-5-hydroxy-6-metoxy-1,4-benzoquinol methylase
MHLGDRPPAADGTGRYDWPACRRFVDDLPLVADLRGRRVLDLGCGPGGAGRAALALGAASVTFADADPDALALVRTRLEDAAPRATTTRHTWGGPVPGGPWDVVLCADVLYRPAFFADLLASVAASLAADGLALFSDPRTSLESELPALAQKAGLTWASERRQAGYTLVRSALIGSPCRTASRTTIGTTAPAAAIR